MWLVLIWQIDLCLVQLMGMGLLRLGRRAEGKGVRSFILREVVVFHRILVGYKLVMIFCVLHGTVSMFEM
jgi:hypothetical protein